ncbi:MAG: hypothetical protein GX787_06530 [Tissierellia bacterium]|nr:hypothetical protein [Tissierellia bacterium]
MREKSKFIAFVLSIIPGLSHLYIGLKERAVIFFIMFVGLVGGTIGLLALTYSNGPIAIFVLGYPLLWLIALVDMFSAWKKIERRQLYNGEVFDESQFEYKLDKKTIALGLSIIPGAGHMYLGYQNKGLALMGTFFFSVFFMGWLGISIFLFTLPLIWFYSFFDCMHTVDGKEEVVNKEFIFPNVKAQWIGFGLIGIGIFILVEKILFPLINYEYRRYIQTSIVSLVFIIIGARMLMKNKKIDETIIDNNEADAPLELRGEIDEE